MGKSNVVEVGTEIVFYNQRPPVVGTEYDSRRLTVVARKLIDGQFSNRCKIRFPLLHKNWYSSTTPGKFPKALKQPNVWMT